MPTFFLSIRVSKLFFIILICAVINFSQDNLTIQSKKNFKQSNFEKSSKLTFLMENPNPNDKDAEIPKNEFSVWGGYSPAVTTALKFGSFTDAKYGIMAIRYSRHLNKSKKFRLKYTVDLIPMAIINYPETVLVQTAPNRFRFDNIRRSSYGFGTTPIGFQGNFRASKKVKPFFNGGLGALYFSRNIPYETEKRLNFIVEFGGGLEVGISKKRAFTIGYKISHISNANRGIINPGFDNNLFYFGYTFFSK